MGASTNSLVNTIIRPTFTAYLRTIDITWRDLLPACYRAVNRSRESFAVRLGRKPAIEEDLWQAQGLFLCSRSHFHNHSRQARQHSLTPPSATYRCCQPLKILSYITSCVNTMENSHAPTLISPDTRTPAVAAKSNPTNGQIKNGAERAGSEPVDPTALSKALKDMEDAGRMRERTPGASPSRKRQRVYGDRSVKTL